MPCSDGQSSYSDGLSDGRAGSRRTIDILEARNDAMAQMLCYLMSNYAFEGGINRLPLPLQSWWKSHQEFDKKREKEVEEINAAKRVRAKKKS